MNIMALPFIEINKRKKREQMLAVDLGNRTTKAVHLQKTPQGFALTGYAILDAPIFEKSLPADLLTEHLKSVSQTFGGKTKLATLTVGVNDAIVRTLEMPPMPPEDLRLVLKHNSRNYLQQDLSSHVFDCHIVNGNGGSKSSEGSKGSGGPKQ